MALYSLVLNWNNEKLMKQRVSFYKRQDCSFGKEQIPIYSHTTQKQYDVNTLHSGNLYQIFTYVKNLDTERTGNVSGMLLYAKTDEVVLPNNEYKMGGNAISVKTLDLDCDFSMIREQLDGIVQSCFELE